MIDEGIVLEGRGEDSGEVGTRFRDGCFEAFDIVIGAEDLVGAILRCGTGQPRRTPGRRTVISALGQHHSLAAGVRPGRHQRHGCRIRAVLAEHGPLRMLDHGRHALRERDHQLRGSRERVAPAHLLDGGRVNFLVRITQ